MANLRARFMQKTRSGWKGQSSQLFLHFLTKFGEQQEQNVGSASRVICLTRDHQWRIQGRPRFRGSPGQRKRPKKKDRLVTLLPANFSLYTTLTLARPAELSEGENLGMHELYFHLENWDGHFLARAKGPTFFSCLTRRGGWSSLPRQLFSMYKKRA